MAIIERPVEIGTGAAPALVTPSTTYGTFRRPVETTGWKSWLFTIDHKKIGIMYGVAAMFVFLVGGVEAMLIRAQLAGPDGTPIPPTGVEVETPACMTMTVRDGRITEMDHYFDSLALMLNIGGVVVPAHA